MTREALTIIEIKDVKEVGTKGAQVLAFKARGPDGKELWYSTFRKSLFDAIKPGESIAADVEVKTQEREGATFTNRQVNRVYVGEQPVAVKGQFQGYRNSGKSPEEIASIEQQVAVKALTELMVAGKIPIDSDEGALMLAWCRTRLAPKQKPTVSSKQTEPKIKPAKVKLTPEIVKVWGRIRDSVKALGWDNDEGREFIAKHFHGKGTAGLTEEEVISLSLLLENLAKEGATKG